jgi:hypothetical protein
MLLHDETDENLKSKTYKTVIFPVALYGCETWSLKLGEEHRLRVSENRLLRIILGFKKHIQAAGNNCIMTSYSKCVMCVICVLCLIVVSLPPG